MSALGLLAGVIYQAVLVDQWWKWHEAIDDLEDNNDDDLVEDFVDDFNLYFDRIIGAMCISVVSDQSSSQAIVLASILHCHKAGSAGLSQPWNFGGTPPTQLPGQLFSSCCL